MSHPDEELLADLALGAGDQVSAEVRHHVDGCPVCTSAVQELRHTVVVTSHAAPSATWDRPPERVWSRIEDTIAAESATPPGADVEGVDVEEAGEAASPAPVATLESRRTTHPRRRVLPWAAGMAAAGITIGLLTGWALWSDTPPPPSTIAQAQLDTLDTQQPLGEASVVRTAGAVDLLVNTTQSLDARDGFLEVWLINKDGKRMVSVGVLGGGAPGTFPISQTLIDQGYVVVDISREQFDDKPQHSGDSLARGTLHT